MTSKDINSQELQTLLEATENKLREKARDNFYLFVRLMVPHFLEEPYVDGAHIRLICDKLEKMEKGEIRRLMLFMPPRSMKSKLASVFYPAWCLGRNPSWQVLSIGHQAEFAANVFSRPVREIIKHAEFQKIFPGVGLVKDVTSKKRWETTANGKYQVAGAGQGISGIGANLAILDDILNEKMAKSEAEREGINRWYHGGLMTRLQPDCRELIINTRYHLHDISGYLLETEEKLRNSDDPMVAEIYKNKPKWDVISIPAILDEEASKLLDHKEGDSYWPERWPKSQLLAKKHEMEAGGTAHDWHALYMQALDVDTPVPTPKGWTTIKNLKVGDKVFGEDGKPVKVINKTEVFKNRECYRVTTNEGYSVVADKDHLWKTKVWRNDEPYSIRTTEYLAERFLGRKGKHPRVPVCKSWELPAKELEVDPYILGLWLGDGDSRQSVFTAEDEDMEFYFKEIEKTEYTPRKLKKKYSFSVVNGFQSGLRKLGLLNNKEVPVKYLRGSKEQRLSLLQGLMDTDGTCQRGQSSFANKNLKLIKAVEELVLSLGGKPYRTKFKMTTGEYCYKVNFYLENSFRLPRKAKLCRKAKSKHYRFLSFEKAEPRDTQCITVDSKNGLFLAGEGCIVTHNCPVPEEGNIIKREWIQDWNGNLPNFSYVIMSVDTAYSEKQTADFSAYTVWGIFFSVTQDYVTGREYRQPNIMLIHAERGKWEFNELKNKIHDEYFRWSPDALIIEKKSSGITLIQELRLRGLPIYDYDPGRDDKKTRLTACVSLFASNVVWFVNEVFTQDVKMELLNFPSSQNDDYVDCTSIALLYLREAAKVWLETDRRMQEEDDEEYYKPKKRSYWSRAANTR